MKKATECKRCKSADLYHGAYCRPCWRLRERELAYGPGTPPPAARVFLKTGDPCPACKTTLTPDNRHSAYALCRTCGNARHRKYQQAYNKARRTDRSSKVRKPAPIQRPQFERKMFIETPDKPTRIIVPPNIKVKRIPSACPTLRQYANGPDV